MTRIDHTGCFLYLCDILTTNHRQLLQTIMSNLAIWDITTWCNYQ